MISSDPPRRRLAEPCPLCNGVLVPAGSVGSGLTERDSGALRAMLEAGAPVVAEVEYRAGRRRENSVKRLGLPYVTPHSARHSFISTMQAQGIEVGLVAKIAGHANAVVTLGHYTQAVRTGPTTLSCTE